MRQEPVVFENEGQKLFGTVHVPDPPHLPPFPALVMLHGFTGNRIEAHQLFVKAARRFAAAGRWAGVAVAPWKPAGTPDAAAQALAQGQTKYTPALSSLVMTAE